MRRRMLFSLLLLAIFLFCFLPIGSTHDRFIFSSLVRLYIGAMLIAILVIAAFTKKKQDGK